MSGSKIVSWFSYQNLSPIEKLMRPDLSVFIAHYRKQADRQLLSGELDESSRNRWEDLLFWADEAERACDDGDVTAIAVAFFNIGAAATALQIEPNYENVLDSACELEERESKRNRPIRERNDKKAKLKAEAQRLAAERWEADKRHELRIGEMCEIVYSLIAPGAQESGWSEMLPGEAIGIKDWLRPVAPAWAKKGGRPRKK